MGDKKKFAEIKRYIFKGEKERNGFIRDKIYNEFEVGMLDMATGNFIQVDSIFLKIVKK